jgi:DNA primase
MYPPALAFPHLKRTVSIETVLTAEGLAASLKRRGQRLVGPCPVHGGDNPQAFVVDLARDLWYCFTRCQGGGDVVELVRRMHHLGYRQSARYLATLAQAPPVPPSPVTASSEKPFRSYTRRLRLDPLAPLLHHKGIQPETAQRFEAGGYDGPGFLQGCLAVRLHDPQARPLGYAGRRLDPQQAYRYGKWKFPSGLPKREILYGFHHIARQWYKGLVVVEGPWGVMRLMQIGFPAVALLGIQLSSVQFQLLCQASRIVLMLDGDEAGRSASRKIAHALTQHASVPVHRIELPQGLDPDDLHDTDLRHRIQPFII